ncbi:MAG: polyribonucleotide nucleotidyltransferase [bacterium]
MINLVEMEFGGRKLSIETGKMAKQAHGSVLIKYGDTAVLVTAVAAREAKENIDFFPLTVHYIEKTYAVGRFPGGFYKREGRPRDKEILTSRLIDRPLRPLFPEGYKNETQIVATVLSADSENDPDVIALTGASTALTISDIPFEGPVAAVRVGRINDEYILNLKSSQKEASLIDLVVAGTKDAVVMVEGGGNMVSEEIMLGAISFAHEEIKKIISLQEELQKKIGIPKRKLIHQEVDKELEKIVKEGVIGKMKEAFSIKAKLERQAVFAKIKEETIEQYGEGQEYKVRAINHILEKTREDILRLQILNEQKRIDGRSLIDIRPITSEVGLLPRTHGSALFTRGETQSLGIVTLGTKEDEQRMDDLEGESSKTFMLHYNFPPFSVAEVGFIRGPGRREIGHGALAERALKAVLPAPKEFAYTVRIVSEILESNGSSSMATVCSGSLALMDAGVPIKSAVAGIAMGLIKEETGKFVILSDILGDEDHCGDMDFKVAGTREGITALQMDIKVNGITGEILQKSLAQAKEGRMQILDTMDQTIVKSREGLSTYAPRIFTMQVKVDKIREIIGSGGKTIRGIIEETGAKINIEDTGHVTIASVDEESAKRAIRKIEDIIQEPEIGKIYRGKVKKIMEFGAFVEIIPNTDGLLHVSQLADYHVKNVEDELKEGEEITVKLIEIDKQGRLKLSRKAIKEGETP